MEVFDDVTQKWYRVAPLNHARSGLQVCAIRQTRGCVKSLLCKFTQPRLRLIVQSCITQLAAVRGKIYAIGGWDDNHEYLDTVEEYDTIR